MLNSEGTQGFQEWQGALQFLSWLEILKSQTRRLMMIYYQIGYRFLRSVIRKSCLRKKRPKGTIHVYLQAYFSKFQLDTLFYIFYSMPKDESQLYAANELYNATVTKQYIFVSCFLHLFYFYVMSNFNTQFKNNCRTSSKYLCDA
ncbi:hypothetical protein ACS0TY_005829 [Phlomoides rotata]